MENAGTDNMVVPSYDAGLWSRLYVWQDKKKILCDTHDTELALYLVIVRRTMGRSQNSTPLWPYVNGHPQRKKTEIGMEMISQRTFHPPARLLVRFILAHIFRLKKKKRINVAAKYTTKPLWTLLREKKKTSWYQTIKTQILARENENEVSFKLHPLAPGRSPVCSQHPPLCGCRETTETRENCV